MTDRPERVPVGAPGDGPYAVLCAGDGAVWTTLPQSGRVARLDPDGTLTVVDLQAPGAQPMQLAVGPDGGVWCTRTGDGRIDRVDRTGPGVALPAGSAPYGLAAGPDGALWFTAFGAEAVGRVDPAGAATLVELPDGGGMPSFLTPGPDGALWFTLNRTGALGRVDTAQRVSVHALPDPGCGPVGITADAGGLWFAEIAAGRVGYRDTTGDTAGRVRETDLPDVPGRPGRATRPHAVLADGTGGCWVTLWGAAALAHVDEGGAVTVLEVFADGDEPHGLARDADALWVALESGFLARIPLT